MDDIYKKNIKAATLLIKAGEKEVKLAKTFPLNLMPQLLKATEIDLLMSRKTLDIAEKEYEAYKITDTDPIQSRELFENCAKRRYELANKKLIAAINLTSLSELKKIHEEMTLLGKRKSRKRKSGKGKSGKRKSRK